MYNSIRKYISFIQFLSLHKETSVNLLKGKEEVVRRDEQHICISSVNGANLRVKGVVPIPSMGDI